VSEACDLAEEAQTWRVVGQLCLDWLLSSGQPETDEPTREIEVLTSRFGSIKVTPPLKPLWMTVTPWNPKTILIEVLNWHCRKVHLRFVK
jgi:hypothetical protein